MKIKPVIVLFVRVLLPSSKMNFEMWQNVKKKNRLGKLYNYY